MKRKVAILGFGMEGKAALRFLKGKSAFRGTEFWILDRNPSIIVPRGAKSVLGDAYLGTLSDFDIVFRSPGVPFLAPQVQAAIKHGTHVSSVTDLFFKSFRGTVIGVTGTKGKGTTATLLYRILKRAGKDVCLAGNIGTPAITLLPKLRKNSIVILEMSSFQLQDLKHSPRYAVVLGIFPDHQDSHKNMREYVDAKRNIVTHQKHGDAVFYAAQNLVSRQVALSSTGMKVPVSADSFGLFRQGDLKILGAHNYFNAVMASTVARRIGVPDATIRAVARSFRGLPYRIQFIREANGIRIYNDSASTNPQTMVAAARSFSGPVVLIAGGKNKGLDYAPLTRALMASSVTSVVLFGENKNVIRACIPGSIPSMLASTLEEAVSLAMEHAPAGGVVVFSPGSASFDMFKNYKDRGAQFDKIVKNL